MHRSTRGNQCDVAVQAAGNVEVAAKRRNGGQVILSLRLSVVDPHEEQIAAVLFQTIGDIEPERREPALVLTKLFAVEPHVGHKARCAELEPVPRARLRRVELEAVPADTPLIVTRLQARRVLGVPGMRQAHRLPVATACSQRPLRGQSVVLYEAPTVVETANAPNPARVGRHGTESGAFAEKHRGGDEHRAGGR